MQDQGNLLSDPCGGTGMLSIERSTSRPHPFLDGEFIVTRATVAARCMCEKGQLQLSSQIPLIVDIVETTEQLQDLYPDGVPDVIPRPDMATMQTSAPRTSTSPVCKCGHRLSQHEDADKCQTAKCQCLIYRSRR